jgi:hypothetical protein
MITIHIDRKYQIVDMIESKYELILSGELMDVGYGYAHKIESCTPRHPEFWVNWYWHKDNLLTSNFLTS